MKTFTRLAVIAIIALPLRASVYAQNLTPVSSTTTNGTASAQPISTSDTTSQTSAPNTQEKVDKAGSKTDKGSSKTTKNGDKADATPRYGRNQTVLKH